MQLARRLGHDVRVLATDYRVAGGAAEEDPDVHRTLRWYWDLDRYEFPAVGSLGRLRLERHNARELDRHLRSFRPDVVAWWAMGCMSLSLIERVRRAGIAAAFLVHDDWLVYARTHDQWLHMWDGPRRSVAGALVSRVTGLDTRVDFERAAPLVFNSTYTRDRAGAAGVDVASASVIHPGVDDCFQHAAPRVPWRWRLLAVGRIDRQKGLDTAVAALAHLPPTATLDVWGTGDAEYITELRQLAERVGASARVRFHGFAASERLAEIYADADVVVFPVRWEEPFGLVPLEAMGCGRPVVSTARGGSVDYLRDGENALVFAPDDAAGLAACVERIASDAPLRERLREGGSSTAARFTSERSAQRTVEAIVAAARSRGGGSR